MLAVTSTVNVKPKRKLADPCVKASPSLSSHTAKSHSMKSDLKADSLGLRSETQMAKEDLKWQACLPSARSPMLQGIPTAMRTWATLVDSVGYKKQKWGAMKMRRGCWVCMGGTAGEQSG